MVALHCVVTPLDIAGGASGTEVSVVTGSVVTFDGKPLNSANVTLRTVNFLYDSITSASYRANHSVFDTVTNTNGTFSFKNVKADTYRIVVSYRDSIAVVIPLRVNSNVFAYYLPPDTVFPMASITGTVSISDGDSVETTVQFYGMDFRAKPDSNGQFILKMPQGTNRIHIGASRPDSNRMKEFDGIDITVGVSYGENKDIGTFHLQPPPPPFCMDGFCDSMVVRNVLDGLSLTNTDIGSVSVVQNGRIVELSLHGKPIFNTWIPPDILKLSAMKKLDLGHTGISIVFPGISKMRNLEVLRLDSNFCTMLPFDIGNLTMLKELNLSANQLTNLPLSIVNIRSATFLDLSNNSLSNLDTTVSAWADRYDPEWRTTQRPVPMLKQL